MSNPAETDSTALINKVRDLCEFLAADEHFATAQEQIKIFDGDEVAQDAYAVWQSTASELQHRYQHEGIKPTSQDLKELEELQQAVNANEVAANFVEANDEMNKLFSSVMKMVQKTFQLGRAPTDDELIECCGSGGCGSC